MGTENEIKRETAHVSEDTGLHQNISRAASVLSALAGAGASGLRFTDVTTATKLSKSVAHRCLSGLLANGLADFDDQTNRFFLGDRIYRWTSLARGRFHLSERVVPFLQKIADATQDTVYFLLRRGDEAVCAGRAEGNFPIKTLTLAVGDRRPLGVGSASLAIFSFLDDGEIDRLMSSQKAARAPYKLQDKTILGIVENARRDGFVTFENHIIVGMSGIGVPIRDASGKPVAGLSVAAISSRMEGNRQKELAKLLKAEAKTIETELMAKLPIAYF